MSVPLAPTKNKLAKVREDVTNLFQRGDHQWIIGGTVLEKKEGLNMILEGMKILKVWISRENDEQMIPILNSLYQGRYDDVKQKLQSLEKFKEKEEPQFQMEFIEEILPSDSDSERYMSGAVFEAFVKDKPNVKWADIAGLDQAKAKVQEAVLLPIKFPKLFEEARKPWKGILLYGPPGTGKTLLAKACATEVACTFLSVQMAYLISQYERGSQNLLRILFQKARDEKPSIIFINEIDIMYLEGQNETRKRVISELLIQMDEMRQTDNGVIVLGTSNLPWVLDNHLIQRFEKRIFIPLPDVKAREIMIKNSLNKTKTTIIADQYADLGIKTEGFSGSDISVLVREALYEPLRKLQSAKKFRQVIVEGKIKWTPVPGNEDGTPMTFTQLNQNDIEIPDVCYLDFLQALKKSKKSLSQDLLGQYDKWTKVFGQEE